MIYTYSYDETFIPALPVAEVQLYQNREEAGVTLMALVDSGSDATMIPLRYLKQIKARKGAQKQIRGIAGLSYPVDTYRVSIKVGPHHTRLTVIADGQNRQMILGRDILNRMIVTLNGLAGVVELSQ